MTTFNLRSNSLPKTVGYDGTIKGVSVITEGEAKGHGCSIDSITLSQVVSCGSKGVPVKMDHSQGLDRIVGSCRNFSIDGSQVRADIQLLKSHAAFEFIKELVAATLEKKNKTDFVRCTQLYSVDLVDLPAANPGGLFSTPDKPKPKITGLTAIQRLKLELGTGTDPRIEPTKQKSTPKGLTAQQRLAAEFATINQ
jgi:hypothetical protein